jgi:hypothetical protein
MHKHVWRFVAAIPLVLLAGCAEDTGAVSGGEGDETVYSNVDSDGDGLSDFEERLGWEISVDETGRTNTVDAPYILPNVYRVTSDPDVADTDGDGLDDYAERQVGSDPERSDTDRDGLGDAAEVLRWRTSPTTVDTDRDARGQFPNSGVAPDPSLFDGAELQLVESELTPGLMVPGPHATSPVDADTDGDSVWDLEETSSATRNPTIAEMPELRVLPDALENFGIYLDVVETTSREVVDEVSTDIGFGAGTSVDFYSSMTLALATWFEYKSNTGAQLNAGVNTTQAGVDVGVAGRTEAHLGTRATISTMMSLSQEFEATANQTLVEASEVVNSVSRQIEGGRVVASLTLQNTGGIPFSAADPTLNLSFVDEDGALKPIGVMTPQNPEDAYTLAAGERLELVVEARDVATDRLFDLLRSPERLIFSPGSMTILNAGSEEYSFIEEDVFFRTATLLLDFGNGEVDRHFVAAHVGRDNDGKAVGRSVTDMLTTLGIEHDDGDEGNGAYRVAGFPTVLHTGDARDLQGEGLDASGYVYTEGPGPRDLEEGWGVLIHRLDGSIDLETNLEARVLPGEQVTFMRVRDEDRDGIPSVLEEMRGSTDASLDTDEDGLSDFWEIREGWQVLVEGQPPLRVFPHPGKSDADADGLDDQRELALGTNPRRWDTDGDGLGDGGDAAPTRYDQARLTDILTYLDDCSSEGCNNSWSQTPGYNLIALGWSRPQGVSAVVLKSVTPLGEEPEFDPTSIRVQADLDDALAAREVSTLYRGAGSTFEDHDLTNSARHTYHFYGSVVGSDGVRYLAYSGSEHREFEPTISAQDYYHVVTVGISPFYIDRVHHNEDVNSVYFGRYQWNPSQPPQVYPPNGVSRRIFVENRDPFHHYHHHSIGVRRGGALTTFDVGQWVRPWGQAHGGVTTTPDTVQDSPAGYLVAPGRFDPVTVCVPQGSSIEVTLATFDRDDMTSVEVSGRQYYLSCPWDYGTLTPEDIGLPHRQWGPNCDDRWILKGLSMPLDDLDVGSSHFAGLGSGNPEPSWSISPTARYHRENYDSPTSALDRHAYNDHGESAANAHDAHQYVSFDYHGYMRTQDAATFCSHGIEGTP